jgi:ABC-type amino acid transport substrate-binding protein
METQDFWHRVLDLKAHYGGWKQLVQAIKNETGWETLNRTTVAVRWAKNASARAKWAIERLEAKQQRSRGAELRIAEPKTLLALPSTLSCMDTDGAGSYLQNRYGVHATRVPVETGGEALTLLSRKEVDVAVAADVLIYSRAFKDCLPLCAISSAPVVAVARRPIETPADLGGIKFGCLKSSAVPELVDRARRERGIRVGALVGYGNLRELTKAYRDRKVEGIIAWDLVIHEVRLTLGASARPATLPEHLFGHLRQGVAVNPHSADPRAVHAYLDALVELSKDPLRRITKVQLATYFGVKNHSPEELRAYRMSFRIHRVNLRSVLKFWTQELDADWGRGGKMH